MRRRIKRKRKYRPMPINLQIRMFTRLFLKANEPYYLDPTAELDKIDHWDVVCKGESYRENLENLKSHYHEYHWEIPKKKKKSSVRDLHLWEPRGVTDSLKIYTISIPIKPHYVRVKRKSKSGLSTRKYEKLYGRIQVTVDKNWIGREAKIIVRIPRLI